MDNLQPEEFPDWMRAPFVQADFLRGLRQKIETAATEDEQIAFRSQRLRVHEQGWSRLDGVRARALQFGAGD